MPPLQLRRRSRASAFFAILGAATLSGCGGDPPETKHHIPDSELDPFVDVPATGPYGTRVVKVPAATNWVNAGLYLRAGQEVSIMAAGSWAVDGETFVGPAGLSPTIERGCPRNGLVARLDLIFDDQELYCIGDGTTMTATRDGIVYLGANLGFDVSEVFGSRLPADGLVFVTLTSDGDTVPTIAASDVGTYDFSQVASGWVELRGHRTIVTVPAAAALADQTTAAASLDTLDAIYDIDATLRSAVPYRSQRVRFIPDPTMESMSAILIAGNPVRAKLKMMSGASNERILRVSEESTWIWPFGHELGHDFTFANGTWAYMIDMESWPNIFTLRAYEGLNRTHGIDICAGKEDYLASGTYTEFREGKDHPLQLCFFMEFTARYGWDFWARFFAKMNTTTNDDIPDDGTDASVWGFVRDRFNDAAGEDTTPLFDTWRIPLPPPT